MFVRNGVASGSVIAVPDVEEEEFPEGYTLPEPEPEAEPESEAAVGESEVEEQSETLEPPSHSDLKSVWVDYAVSQGYSREEAEALTKQDLIEIFTE